MELDKFHELVGETIMYCQIIEHDIKCIYSAMRYGKYYDNLEETKKWTLGKAVEKLKDLDFSSKKTYISSRDYNFLKQMTKKRNHWCHQTYQNFLYIENEQFLESEEYLDECRKLERDNERLSLVSDVVEGVRIQAIKDFRQS